MHIPGGIQFDTKFTIIGPDGATAVFNDPTDPEYVGMLTELTGFDMPEVRENADNLVQMDGGIHGDFFFGRRPFTMSGRILPIASATDRNSKITHLQRAVTALRGDAIVKFTPDGGQEQFLAARVQQPLRISGNWIKDFQIAMVAADPRRYSTVLESSTVAADATAGVGGFSFNLSFPINFGAASPTGQVLVENNGNMDTWPVLTITGPGTNPSIYNASTDQRISFAYTLAAGETLVVDTLNRTVKLNGVTDRYSALDFTNTEWWPLIPGINDIRLAFASYSAGATLKVDWRHAWL
jgi:hypothetical protein